MNEEAKFLGGLLPSHPDYEPIIAATRLKYGLQEVYPLDDPTHRRICMDTKMRKM